MLSQNFQAILAASRLPFLTLPPICILLASASIYHQFQIFNLGLVMWILIGAVSAHVSVNLFNEYSDFKSGLDFNTKKTPFSGGSGALPDQPDSANSVLYAAIFTLLLTAVAGLYLLSVCFFRDNHLNYSLLLIGLSGLILILIYTGPINRHPLLCLISPGLGFGWFMVYGTSSALLGDLPLSLLPAAFLLFLLVNNLLLLNQLPDLEADRSIGRKHIWIVKGEAFGVGVYLFTTLLIPVLFLIAILCKIWPVFSLLALIPWCLTLAAWKGAKRLGTEISVHPQFLAMNVIATLSIPLVLSIILVIYC